MLRLKQRESIPNGFWVEVPEIKFREQFWDFGSAARSLWQTLRANPGVTSRFPHLPRTEAACADYVDAQNALRVSHMKGAESYVKEGGPALQVPFPRRQGASAAAPSVASVGGSAANKPPAWFKRIKTGVATLADWLGSDGNPVPADLAEKRAGICVACPKNKPGDLFSYFTGPVANLLRRQLEERQQLKLSTTQDGKLGVCEACGCPLVLKLHVPLPHILKHMPAADQAALDANCWIRKGT